MNQSPPNEGARGNLSCLVARSLGLKFSAFTVAVAALTINVGAYTAEIMRAGRRRWTPNARLIVYWPASV